MSIIVDNREQYVIKEINRKQKLRPLVTIETLVIGDFIVKNKDQDTVLVIERKTWSDLNSSIMDGRYRNQKERLIKYCLDQKLRRDQIMYIIEGNYDDSKHKLLLESTLKTACVNLQIRDGFRVYFTDSPKDTVEFLQKTINCLSKYNNYSPNNKVEGGGNEFYKTLSVVKKENLTPKRVYLAQLSIIPGVSIKKAESIYELFPDLVSLIDELKGSNNGDILRKIKGIGPKLSEKIYCYIIKN